MADASSPSSPREAIRELLRETLERKGDRSAFGDDELLISSGRLDSVDVLEIVTWLEGRGIDFTVVAFDPDRLDSVEAIEALLREVG